MNTRIQPQIEIELTDEQLANISGGWGHRDFDCDDRRRDRFDCDDRHRKHFDCDDRRKKHFDCDWD
jgi:bacteriocin-like protein